MSGKASKLVNDLTKIPNIVGGLGLSIAAAQKAFNLDYMEAVERVLAMTMVMAGGKKKDGDGSADMGDEVENVEKFKSVFLELLTATALPRYQYTETTLSVKLDLAQTMDMSGSAGLGVGFGGVSVNAAFAMAYGSDYRAAAEVRTVIHAYTNTNMASDLFARAKELNDRVLELPELAEVDRDIIDAQRRIVEKLVGVETVDTSELATE